MGTALAARLREAGVRVQGPAGRGATGETADVVLLAVPDGAIADAAAHIAAGRLVGHLSGASTLDPLAPHEAFSIHPLMTITTPDVSLAGVPAALAGSTDRALGTARALAAVLGMAGFGVADEDRAAYHAAATIASNYLVTLEGAAEQLAATAGVPRAALVPLVRATVENWAAIGAGPALTGPVARGDEETVSRQRAAVAERLPDRLALVDALADATRDLAASTGNARRRTRARRLRVIRTIADLRTALGEARRRGSIGFVPTMGALHEGHLSLVTAAREETDTVVLSIFVNPTQFNEAADLAAYPRTEERDVELAATAGVDIVFAPEASEIYPTGFATTVSVSGGIAETLEGAARGRAHFDGVATVVTKLLLAVLPDTAYFGAKDAQQVVVVRRAVADLNLPVRIAVRPTSRDPDGLARSSRNRRLDPDERRRALAIPRALQAAADAIGRGETDAAAIRERALATLAAARLDTEYVAVVDPDSFEPVSKIASPALLVIAARVGATRLIDNATLEPRER
ncbi:pantoate--beta-alanine ligase [Microbacterium sp.]|uniref:pantoate--beta-alanine ligase n=1 Tax=Microbacterium sp. TaxID=51671 RepID=UPI002D7E2E02|nr:pantoate--beta-alanine ligase [Microbacterium sp.]